MLNNLSNNLNSCGICLLSILPKRIQLIACDSNTRKMRTFWENIGDLFVFNLQNYPKSFWNEQLKRAYNRSTYWCKYASFKYYKKTQLLLKLKILCDFYIYFCSGVRCSDMIVISFTVASLNPIKLAFPRVYTNNSYKLIVVNRPIRVADRKERCSR